MSINEPASIDGPAQNVFSFTSVPNNPEESYLRPATIMQGILGEGDVQ